MDNNIVWREGTFIRPQHFQQQDRQIRTSFMKHTKELQSNSFGFFTFEIDSSLLGTGKLVLNKASGVLPDGELFDISSQSHTLSVNIKEGDSSKYVYLALPILSEGSNEVYFEDEKEKLTRYVAKNNTNVPNINSNENSNADLLCTSFNFKLLLENDLDDSYIALKIAKIGAISPSGMVSLDENFNPVFLHLNGTKKLVNSIKDLISMIEYRAEKLAEKLSESAVQATELGDYLMLQLINKSKTRIYYYLSQDRLHPADLYLELISFLSELAVFMKKEKRLSNEPKYIHQEQNECFDFVLKELKDMLNVVLEQNSISIPIKKHKFGVMVAKLPDFKVLTNSTFILAIYADVQNDKLIKFLLSNLKIGTTENIRNLVNYHLAGFKIKYLSAAPRQIPYRMNYIYFKIELDKGNIKELKKSTGFAFHLSKELPNAIYNLWAIRND